MWVFAPITWPSTAVLTIDWIHFHPPPPTHHTHTTHTHTHTPPHTHTHTHTTHTAITTSLKGGQVTLHLPPSEEERERWERERERERERLLDFWKNFIDNSPKSSHYISQNTYLFFYKNNSSPSIVHNTSWLPPFRFKVKIIHGIIILKSIIILALREREEEREREREERERGERERRERLHDSEVKCLLYADDLVLMSPHSRGLHTAWPLEQYCEEWALMVHLDKPESWCSREGQVSGNRYQFSYGGISGAQHQLLLPGSRSLHRGLQSGCDLYEKARRAFYAIKSRLDK